MNYEKLTFPAGWWASKALRRPIPDGCICVRSTRTALCVHTVTAALCLILTYKNQTNGESISLEKITRSWLRYVSFLATETFSLHHHYEGGNAYQESTALKGDCMYTQGNSDFFYVIHAWSLFLSSFQWIPAIFKTRRPQSWTKHFSMYLDAVNTVHKTKIFILT